MPSFLHRYDFPIHLLVMVGYAGHALSLWWNTLCAKVWLRVTGCSYGPGFKVCGRPILRIARRGALRFGEGVMLQSRLRSNMAGGTSPTTLQCFDGAHIVFGNGSGCSLATISCRSSVTIGDNVLIGANVRIYDHDFHPVDPESRRRSPNENVATRPILVGNDVFIGAQAVILKGVTIGDRAVVGAGAVVSKDVPADEIWAGNPARRVGSVTAYADAETRRRHMAGCHSMLAGNAMSGGT